MYVCVGEGGGGGGGWGHGAEAGNNVLGVQVKFNVVCLLTKQIPTPHALTRCPDDEIVQLHKQTVWDGRSCTPNSHISTFNFSNLGLGCASV